MRDFRHAKSMASTLREELAARGLAVTHSESLELIAKVLGQPNWNTLSAAIARSKPIERRLSEPLADQQFPDLMRPFWARYLTDAELRAPADWIKARWEGLFDEARDLFASSADPSGPEALSLARRWLGLTVETGGGDDGTSSKYWAAYRDALADPTVASKLPVSAEVLTYLTPAFSNARSELVAAGVWRPAESA